MSSTYKSGVKWRNAYAQNKKVKSLWKGGVKFFTGVAPVSSGSIVLAQKSGRNLATSLDSGNTWRIFDTGISGNWIVSFGGGRFVARLYNAASYSFVSVDDGITWQKSATTAVASIGIDYGAGRFGYGSHNTANFYTSPDGLNWALSANTGTARKWKWSAYSPQLDRWVASQGTYAYAMYSSDGAATQFTQANFPSLGSFDSQSIMWSHALNRYSIFSSQYVAATGRNISSPDGITWTARDSLPAGSNHWSHARGQENLEIALAFGTSGLVAKSTDLINWNPATNTGLAAHETGLAAYDVRNARHIVADYNTAAAKFSTDFGITWQSLPALPFIPATLAVN